MCGYKASNQGTLIYKNYLSLLLIVITYEKIVSLCTII